MTQPRRELSIAKMAVVTSWDRMDVFTMIEPAGRPESNMGAEMVTIGYLTVRSFLEIGFPVAVRISRSSSTA